MYDFNNVLIQLDIEPEAVSYGVAESDGGRGDESGRAGQDRAALPVHFARQARIRLLEGLRRLQAQVQQAQGTRAKNAPSQQERNRPGRRPTNAKMLPALIPKVAEFDF